MQKINNIFNKAALAVITAVLATGCIFEKMEMPKDLQSVLIQINVSADELQTKSEPTSSESAINTLHIYAFSGNGLAGYHQRNATTVNEPFLMDLVLPEGTSIPVDFYLIANASSMMDRNNPVQLSETMTKAQLEALKYTRIASGSPLPLYCKEQKNLNTTQYTASEAQGHIGHLELVEKVHFTLTRSLAKLSVYGAKPAGASTSPNIISVTMLAGGTREYSYLYPQTDEILNAVPSQVNDRTFPLLDQKVMLNEISGAANSAASYTPVMTAPAYLAEVTYGSMDWSVTSGNAREVSLKIEYSLSDGGELKTGYIYMPPIQRNKHYKVCILISSQDEGKITVTYDVADWNDHNIPDFEFAYPTHSYVRESIPVTDADLSVKPSGRAEMSETKAFEGYFQMTAPVSESFTPTLVGNRASEAEITIYKYETSELITERPVPAYNGWYKIKVTPNNDFPIGETVNLALTYKPGLIDGHEFLLINGSAGNFYWPSSTDANYVTITMVN